MMPNAWLWRPAALEAKVVGEKAGVGHENELQFGNTEVELLWITQGKMCMRRYVSNIISYLYQLTYLFIECISLIYCPCFISIPWVMMRHPGLMQLIQGDMPFYELPQSRSGCGTLQHLRLPHGLESHLCSAFLPWNIPERYFTNAFFLINYTLFDVSPLSLPPCFLPPPHPSHFSFFLDPFPGDIFTCLKGTFLSRAFPKAPFSLALQSAA